jgi:hypothetical protein
MSGSPTSSTNQRRTDSLAGGQILLLAAAVATSAVFSFLYITSRPGTAKEPMEPSKALIPAAPVASPAAQPMAKHEPTSIPVEQVLLVGAGEGKAGEKILVRTPAVFPTGSVQWTPEQVEVARALQARLTAILRHQDAIDRELERIESQWKLLIQHGVPSEVLFPDSPTLPSSTPAQP